VLPSLAVIAKTEDYTAFSSTEVVSVGF